MRFACLMTAGLALLCNGCSLFMNQWGKNVSTAQTREEAQRDYGTPIARGQEEDGGEVLEYEEFFYRGKVAPDVVNQTRDKMALGFTYGLHEFVLFPCRLGEAVRQTVLGSRIRFYYDSDDFVAFCQVNGEDYVPPGRYYARLPKVDLLEEQAEPARAPLDLQSNELLPAPPGE